MRVRIIILTVATLASARNVYLDELRERYLVQPLINIEHEFGNVGVRSYEANNFGLERRDEQHSSNSGVTSHDESSHDRSDHSHFNTELSDHIHISSFVRQSNGQTQSQGFNSGTTINSESQFQSRSIHNSENADSHHVQDHFKLHTSNDFNGRNSDINDRFISENVHISSVNNNKSANIIKENVKSKHENLNIDLKDDNVSRSANKSVENDNERNKTNIKNFQAKEKNSTSKTTTDNELVTPDSVHNGRNVDKNKEDDEKWIWDVETTTVVDGVTLDDRAAFSGDKCATGLVRVAGRCVEAD